MYLLYIQPKAYVILLFTNIKYCKIIQTVQAGAFFNRYRKLWDLFWQAWRWSNCRRTASRYLPVQTVGDWNTVQEWNGREKQTILILKIWLSSAVQCGKNLCRSGGFLLFFWQVREKMDCKVVQQVVWRRFEARFTLTSQRPLAYLLWC